MKNNYWSSRHRSSGALLLIAVLSVSGMGAVELFQTEPVRLYVNEQLTAATHARQAMDAIKAARLERNLPIDPATDPAGSGLIGRLMSPVTSNNGHLPAKQTTVNPNFAAVVVEMLKEAGVQQGDMVAVGFSGSFPAMNIAVLSAVETLKLRPVIISSSSASQWGANHPELLWIDMEKELHERGLIRHRSVAASIGGVEDRGIGVSGEGLEMLRQAIKRNELPMIDPENYLDSVNQRMALYRRHAERSPIRAYINVGGGTTSVGTMKGKALFEPGLNLHKPPGTLPVDSVMARFIGDNVPVIHLVQINRLAARYGLPVQPVEIAKVGEGEVYSPQTYNKWLAGGLLGAIVICLFGVARSQPRLANSDSTKNGPIMKNGSRGTSVTTTYIT